MASKDETNQWIHFFEDAGLPSNVAVKYALTFSENRIKKAMLLDLNKEYLKEMGITLMGDIISILKHAKDVSEEDARTNILKGQEVYGPALPPRPVVKKTSVSVPASRILDHFTPKVASKAVVQTAVVKKRPLPAASKNYEESSDESEPEVLPKPPPKKAPQIRSTAVAKRVITKTVVKPKAPVRQKIQPEEVEVIEPPTKKVRRVLPEHEGKYNIIMPAGTSPRTQKIMSDKVVVSSTASKKTVFDRLGDSSVSSTTGGMVSPVREVEPRITITGLGNPIRPVTQLTSEKFNSSVFSRLGNKPMAAVAASATYHDEVEEQPKLKYAGVLKKPATAPTTLSLGPIKKKMIRTIIKKRVPISGTMRSDLQEPGVQQRLGVSSTTTVAKVLPIKKNIISLKKPQPPVRSSVATIKPGQGDMRYRVKNRISSTVTNSSFSTTKKVVASRIQAVTSTSSKYGKDSGNVFARLGR